MSDDLLSVSSPDSNVIYQDFDRAVQRNLLLQVRVDALQTWQEHAIASQQAERENAIQARQEILALNETNAVLQARCDGLQSDKEASESEKESLEAEVQSLQQCNVVLKTSLTESESELRAQNNELQLQNHLLQRSVVELEQKSDRSLRVVESLQQEMGALQIHCHELRLELESMHECLQKEVESTIALENEKEQAIASLRESNSRLAFALLVTLFVILCVISNNATLRQQVDSASALVDEKDQEIAYQQETEDAEKDNLLRQVGELTVANDRISTEAEQGRIETLEETQDVLDIMQDELDRNVGLIQNLWYEIEFGKKCDKAKDREINLLKDQVKFYRSSDTPGRQLWAGSTSVTPAPRSKRDKSMSAITESSTDTGAVVEDSAESKSPKKKKMKSMSHKTTCNAQPEPAAIAMPDDDESTTNEPSMIPYHHENENEANISDTAIKFSQKPAGTLDLEEGGEDFVETEWGDIGGDIQFRRDTFKLLTREGDIGEMDKKLADAVIGNCLVWLLFFNPVIGSVVYSAWYIAGMMIHMMNSMKVFVVYFARGAAASGRDSKRLYNILMKYPFFRTIIRKIEENYLIIKLGMIWNQSGNHGWHQDKFQEPTDFRGIGSLLSSVKIMWFRDTHTGAQFGITVPHYAFVVLTRYGSGAEGTLQHKVTGANNSAIFTFDFCPQKRGLSRRSY